MDIKLACNNMIKQQIRAWGVLDENILDLMASIQREDFVPTEYQQLAYADVAIPIGYGKTMLPPKLQAHLIQALSIQSNETVLEIGTGTGFCTALLAKQAKHVFTIEIMPELQKQAQKNLANLEIANVSFIEGDGSAGWPKEAPYDAIVLTGSLQQLPASFRQQLNVGGRIFAVLGKAPVMTATIIFHPGENEWNEKYLFETVIPPLENAKQAATFEF